MGVCGAIVCQVALLIIVGRLNRHMINPDAVVYLRIASYYSSGQIELVVTGYWGPMISWLIAPLLGMVANPLDAARIVMGFSAVIFLLGCISLFRSLELHPVGLVLGTWLAALASVAWSVQAITPDLLVTGLMCFATSTMLSPRWIQTWRSPLAAGMLWGAAYLTKSVALPIAFAVGIGITSLYVVGKFSSIKPVLRSLGITLLSFLLLAAPWIVLLSLKYHRFVFSTTAKIAHAVVGPPDLDRWHPLLVFYTPEPGRIFWFEDPPASLYQEKYWSPFDSLAYTKHQLKVMYFNSEGLIRIFSGFDSLHLGFCAAFLGLLVHTPWRRNMQVERWRWTGGLIVCFSGVYLPVYAEAERYYYPAYPLLIAASVGMVVRLTRSPSGRLTVTRLIGLSLIGLSFANPIRIMLREALRGLDNPPAVYARDLATRLQEAGVQGSIAGGGDLSNPWRADYLGPYVAFFTNQPYLGSQAVPEAEKFKAIGAGLVILDRKLPLSALDRDPAFRNLDSVLFRSKDEADRYPLKTYQVVSH